MNMGFLTIVAIAMSSLSVNAAVLNTAQWTQERAPSYEDRRGRWIRGDGLAYRTYIAVGSLLSNFSVDGDFEFGSTQESVPFASTSFPIMYDNDPIGVVFGWQDSNNHYRLGAVGVIGPGAGGPSYDKGSSLELGIWLIREENGVDHVLFNDRKYRYVFGKSYDVTVGRSGDYIYFSYGLDGKVLYEGSFFDTTFMSGRIGVYSESTPSLHTNLNLTRPSDALMATTSLARINPVPVPASLPLLLGGLAALGWMRHRRGQHV